MTNLLRNYTRCTGAAILLALGAMTTASESGGMALFAIPVAAALWWLSSRPGKGLRAPRWLVNVLLSAAVGLALLRATAGVEVGTIAQLVVALLLIKIVDRNSPRDDAQILALAIFLAIAAMLDSNRLIVGIQLFILLPIMVAAIMLHQLHPAWWPMLRGQAEPAASSRLGLGRAVRGTVVATTVLVFLTAAMVFMLMPRGVGENVFGPWGRPRGGSVTGFTDRVSLGRRNVISESPEIAFDIEIRDATRGGTEGGDSLGSEETVHYLRGAVLDTYRDGVWLVSPRVRQEIIEYAGPYVGAIELRPGTSRAVSVMQRLTMRGGVGRDREVPVFHVWRPVRVSADRTGRFRFDRSNLTLGFAGDAGPLTITIWSDLADVQGSSSPAPPRQPPTPSSDRIAQYTRQLLAAAGLSADDVDAETEPALCRAIQEHLRTQFTYSLEEAAVPEGIDPTEHFLFTTRKGHCEYFASAMVAMCRSIGIHARVITGYVATEYNPATESYTVRQSNAHAWVEAGLQRWRRYDPTAPADLQRIHRPQTTIAATIRRWIDAVEYVWNDSFVSFDERRRARMFATSGTARLQSQWIEHMSARMQSAGRRGAASALGWGLATFIGVGVLAAALAFASMQLRRRWSRRRGQHSAGPDAAHAPATHDLLASLLRELRRRGFDRPRATPVMDHAQQIPGPWSDLTRDIARAYYAERFGRATPPPADLAQLRAALATAAAAPIERS